MLAYQWVPLLLASFLAFANAFAPASFVSVVSQSRSIPTALAIFGQKPPAAGGKLSQERKKQLGVPDDADEYDLSEALNNNTDPLITKVIAGSLILAIIAGLVAGVVIPLTTDYGEGVCNAALKAGRC